jgi:hypothetical protein
VKHIRIVIVAAALAGAGSVSAAGIGIRAGTTGIGGDIAFGLVPTLSARVGYSYLNYSTDIDVTDINYDAKLKLSNANFLLDWHPLGPLFRVSGGIIANDNKIDVDGRPSGGTFTINGVTYPAAAVGSLSGQIKTGNSAAPYLGIGYGTVAGTGVNFYFDLGVMFQGSPKATLTATCGAGLPAVACAQLQSDVAAEAVRLQNDVNRFKYYPVANIGVTIGF